jgi:hypothetical protein
MQASATGYYGPDYDGQPASVKQEGFLARLCREWENTTLGYKDLPVRVVIIRTGVVLTRDGGFLAKTAPMFKMFLGGHFGNGRQWLPWIHMKDAVEAIYFLLHNTASEGPFNLTAPQAISQKEFFKELGKAMNRPSWLHAPEFAIRTLLGEMGREAVLGSQKALPDRLLEEGFSFRFGNVKEALKEIYR